MSSTLCMTTLDRNERDEILSKRQLRMYNSSTEPHRWSRLELMSCDSSSDSANIEDEL